MLFNMTMRAQLKLLEVVKGCTLGAVRRILRDYFEIVNRVVYTKIYV